MIVVALIAYFRHAMKEEECASLEPEKLLANPWIILSTVSHRCPGSIWLLLAHKHGWFDARAYLDLMQPTVETASLALKPCSPATGHRHACLNRLLLQWPGRGAHAMV